MKRIISMALIGTLIATIASVSFAASSSKKMIGQTVTAKKPVSVKINSTAKPAVVTVKKAEKDPLPKYKFGLIGGAATAAVGIYLPMVSFTPTLYAGLGSGNKYYMGMLQLEGIKPMGEYDFGYSIDWAYYSTRVRNIPGLSEFTSSGLQIGLGINLSKLYNNYRLALGYSTVLGLTATAGITF